MQWDITDILDNRIAASTDWVPLDDYTDSIEARAGVYVFADDDKEVLYVGKAGAGRLADEIGDAISRNKDLGATLVYALYTNSDDVALDLELDLITKYDPPNNGVDLTD